MFNLAKIATRNLRRYKRRTLLTVSLIAFGVVFVLVFVSVSSSFKELMITQITENGVSFVINFFLGRLANPDLALAAFGVVNALKSLVASPLRNMAQTAQALVHNRHDMHVMLRFAHRVTLV